MNFVLGEIMAVKRNDKTQCGKYSFFFQWYIYLAKCFKASQRKKKNAQKMISLQTLDDTLFAHTTHVIQDTEPRMDIPVLRHQYTLMGICSLRRQFHTSQHSKVDTILEAARDYD